MKFEADDFPPGLISAIADAVAERVIDRLAQPVALDEVMDTKTAAAHLDLSTQQLEIWRCRGGGPRYSKLQRRVRYRKSDLDAWLAERQRGSTSEGTS